MSRSVLSAFALVFAAAALEAQTPTPQSHADQHASMTHAAMPHDSSACAQLHQLMGGAHPQLDSTQMAAIHAHIQDALAAGISIDSVHKALMAHLSGGQSGQMTLTADQASAIKACVVSVQHEQTAKQK